MMMFMMMFMMIICAPRLFIPVPIHSHLHLCQQCISLVNLRIARGSTSPLPAPRVVYVTASFYSRYLDFLPCRQLLHHSMTNKRCVCEERHARVDRNIDGVGKKRSSETWVDARGRRSRKPPSWKYDEMSNRVDRRHQAIDD